MTTTTVFGSTADGYVLSNNASYATAAAGSNLSAVNNTEGYVGQDNAFNIYQLFLAFDTSGVPDSETISAAELSLWVFANQSTTDFTATALGYDWSSSGLTTADWRTPVQLAALTSLATFNTSGVTGAAYHAFTSAGAAFNSYVSKTGTTYFMVASSRNTSSTQPTGNEYVGFRTADQAGTTNDPKIVITSSVPVSVTADGGSYALTGTAVTPKLNRKVAAVVGSYDLTGSAATLNRGQTFSVGPGSYALDGLDTALVHAVKLVAGLGEYALTGSAATLTYVKGLDPESGAYLFAGYDATLINSYIPPIPEWRIARVQSANRSYLAPAQNRTFHVP